ncbi:MAG TPA: hypothetical protein VKA35_03385 [Solirubrobacterales bacterium]|nr:hypothetical protein [Solirubrobacterales bacterium]
MNKALTVALVALVALALAVAGCGGGDDSTGSTEVSVNADLTKAQFLQQANAICAKANQELDQEIEEFAKEHNLGGKKEPTKEVLAEAAEEILLPSATRQVEEIRDLGAPAGEEKAVDKILTAAEKAVEESEEDPAKAALSTGGPFTDANKLASDYGLKRCGE